MVIYPNKIRNRSEGGHAWTLKGKCRFCGMTKVDFKLQNQPGCQWHGKSSKPKAPPQANEQANE